MAEIYIVVNGRGLNVRSKPDTETGAVLRVMANGEAFEVVDVFYLDRRTWARLPGGDGVQQEYCCLEIGNKIYARRQGLPDPLPAPAGWASALDAWARSQGYTGPRPSPKGML